jgi:hypothetical protein
LDRLAMFSNAGALDNWFGIPIEAEPLQTLKNIGSEGIFTAFLVGVFNAKQELAPMAAGKQPIKNSGACCADV